MCGWLCAARARLVWDPVSHRLLHLPPSLPPTSWLASLFCARARCPSLAAPCRSPLSELATCDFPSVFRPVASNGVPRGRPGRHLRVRRAYTRVMSHGFVLSHPSLLRAPSRRHSFIRSSLPRSTCHLRLCAVVLSCSVRCSPSGRAWTHVAFCLLVSLSSCDYGFVQPIVCLAARVMDRSFVLCPFFFSIFSTRNVAGVTVLSFPPCFARSLHRSTHGMTSCAVSIWTHFRVAGVSCHRPGDCSFEIVFSS